MQKSFPPLEGYGARCFAIVVRAKKLSPLREYPLSSSLPLLSPLCGESRGDGRRGVGGRLRRPPTPLFPCFPLPTPQSGVGRGKGGGAISRCIGRRSNYPVGAKNLSPKGAKNLSPPPNGKTCAWLAQVASHADLRRQKMLSAQADIALRGGKFICPDLPGM